MNRVIAKIKASSENKQGATLVELIVCFGLICFFVISAGALLTSYFNIFNNVNSYIKQQQIAATLGERISGAIVKCTHVYDSDIIVISENSTQITIRMAQGYKARINVGSNGMLELNYSISQGEADETLTGYGEGFYMGNSISGLHFEQVPDSSIIKIYLRLYNRQYDTTYDYETIIDCGISPDKIVVLSE